MIFDDIVSFVCNKIGQTDDASVSICGQFLTSRAETIWDSQPWRESLSIVALNLPNLTAWQSCPFLLIPGQIGRVMKVRFASTMTLESWETITTFDLAPQAFDQTGQPVSFSQLPSVVSQVAGSGVGTLATDDTFRFEVALGDIGNPNSTFSLWMERASGVIVKVENQEFTDEDMFSPISGAFILKLTRTITGSNLLLQPSAGFGGNGILNPGVNLAISETDAPRVQRIRMQPAPTGAGTVLVLGKRAFPGFSTGQQYTLANLDNALQDFVQADMLERDRQYAKAQAKIQSANTLVQLAFGLETRQAANERRIIPSCISGFYAAATFGFGAGGGDKEYW